MKTRPEFGIDSPHNSQPMQFENNDVKDAELDELYSTH